MYWLLACDAHGEPGKRGGRFGWSELHALRSGDADEIENCRDLANQSEYVANGLVSGGIYAIVAVGFITIYNVSKVINLAQGEFLMLGGMVTVAMIGLEVPYALAALLAILLVTLIGV